MTITNADVEKAYKLAQQIKTLSEEYDALKAKLREGLDPNTYKAGDYELTIRQGQASVPTTSHAVFFKKFNPEDNPDLYNFKPRPVSELRKLIPAEDLEPFVAYTQPAVVIKLAKK